MDRRDFIAGVAASAAVIGTSSYALAGDHKHHGHDHMATKANPYQAAIDALGVCIVRGKLCINHCRELLSVGDTSMKRCLAAALDMAELADAFVALAAFQSKQTKALTQVVLAACEECEAACREHEKHHEVCRLCAESCAESIKQLKKI